MICNLYGLKNLMKPENIRWFDLIQCVLFKYTHYDITHNRKQFCILFFMIRDLLEFRPPLSFHLLASLIVIIWPHLEFWPSWRRAPGPAWPSHPQNWPDDGGQSWPRGTPAPTAQNKGLKSFALFFPLHLEADTYSICKTQCLYTQL